MQAARYDGHTAWYDGFASGELFESLRRDAVALLGDGPGRCLDLGCGTGRSAPHLRAAGWSVVGVDVSADQLEAAAELCDDVRLADAHALPFEDGSFDAVISLLTHTDFDDARHAFGEAHRVLRHRGTLVYAGVHPCFAAPNVEPLDDGTALIHPGYRSEGWQTVSRDPDNPGIRSRVGVNHVMLATLLNDVLSAGFRLEAFAEPGEREPPLFLALRATKR